MKPSVVTCFLLLLVFGLGSGAHAPLPGPTWEVASSRLHRRMRLHGAAQFRSWTRWSKPDGTPFSPHLPGRGPRNSRESTPYMTSFWYSHHEMYATEPFTPDWVDEWSAHVYGDAQPDPDATIGYSAMAFTEAGYLLPQQNRLSAVGGGQERCGLRAFPFVSVPNVLLILLGQMVAICKALCAVCPSLGIVCVLALLVSVTGDSEHTAATAATVASPPPSETISDPSLGSFLGFARGLSRPQGLTLVAFSLIIVGWGAAFMHMIPGSAVPRIPPAWSPDMAHRYPFRHWAQDVLTWSIAAEGDPSRKAALLTMSLKGTAYEFCRTIPPMTLIHGGAINGHHVDPLTYIMHALAERFADLGEELRLTSITDLFNFSRQGNERIDELITRFDLIRQRSFDLGQLTMSITGLAYILLRACEVNDSELLQLLLPLQGRFPNDEQEFQVLKTQLRRMGHIVEHSPGNIAAALRGRNSQPQYLATDPSVSTAEHHAAYMAHGAAEQSSSAAASWGYGGDEFSGSGLQFEVQQQSAFLADLESDGATDTDTASSTGHTEVPSATPEGWTDEASLQEHLFWSYSRAKATWRKYMGRPTRAVRRFTRRYIGRQSGKGKGKNKSWGKGRRPNVAAFLASLDDEEVAMMFPGFKGRKGKGRGKRSNGKGKGRARNPLGKDGQRMRCFRCGSENHLSRECHLPRTDGHQHQVSTAGAAPNPNFYASAGVADEIPAQGPLADFVFMAVPSDQAAGDTDSSWSFATDNDAWATYLRSRGAFHPPGSNAQSSQAQAGAQASANTAGSMPHPPHMGYSGLGPNPCARGPGPQVPPGMQAGAQVSSQACAGSMPHSPHMGCSGLGPNPCACGSGPQMPPGTQAGAQAGAHASPPQVPLPPVATQVIWTQSPPTLPTWAQMPLFSFLQPTHHEAPAHVPLVGGLHGSGEPGLSSLEGPATHAIDGLAATTVLTTRRWLGEAIEGEPGMGIVSRLEGAQQGQIETFRQAQQVVQTRRSQQRNRHRRVIQVPDTWDHHDYDALDDSCALCREEYLERDSVVRLVCRHLYHTACWTEYLMHPQARMSCPVCRGSARVIARFSYRADYETPGPSQPTSEHPSRAASEESRATDVGARTPTRRPETYEMNTPPPAAAADEEPGESPYNFEAFHASRIFPWWPSVPECEGSQAMVLHSTSHQDYQCILIDPGAYTNLAGLRWVRQLAHKCSSLGLPVTQRQLNAPLSIAGVGQGTQQCTWSVKLPIGVHAIKDGEECNSRCHFEAPVVGGTGAGLPALLGLRSLRAKNAILVLSEQDEDLKLLIPGPGGWEYERVQVLSSIHS